MARVKTGVMSRKRHKKILKLARGYRNARSKLFRSANQTVMKALTYAYAHRKKRKGDFRRLWITRINAAARMSGISYSCLINGLKQAGIVVNRKMLADLAVNDLPAFNRLVEAAKAKNS
ncbi:50S ribosomal protein L20 [Heliophilum fasciatum]|uniref:Large ribosomal subunit protein bL20 n=1 Tax=Heliophilum fasciatum TaxID=35700 RepID=A0A4R2RZ54_9FIRM|nr:50S ribosomal protein L20 [Heliophilum fasciatum]MCW2276761.1 large subunit ribosomal protein L20 [Heliophilum fasciatum]TCP68858.1 LSU ribosomal protein L20P [Heliophilum fasciatum]